MTKNTKWNPTLRVIHPETGEQRPAQVFVVVLGASNYTYAEAIWSQCLENWVMSHVRCFDFFGGVPEQVVPDNLKSGIDCQRYFRLGSSANNINADHRS